MLTLKLSHAKRPEQKKKHIHRQRNRKVQFVSMLLFDSQTKKYFYNYYTTLKSC